MKQACYWEEYGGTRANDADEYLLIFAARIAATSKVARGMVLGRRSALVLPFERHQRRRGVQSRRKILHESSHRGMPAAVVPEEIHLFQCLIRGEFFESHAVAGHKNASAIIAEAAVHKNFLLRRVAKNRQKLRHLFVRRGRPTRNWDMNEVNSQ